MEPQIGNSKLQSFVIATMTGILLLIAAAWFGWQHASKKAEVNLSAADQGRILVETNECRDCHKLNDPFKAPTLEGLFGAEIDLADGRTIIADEGYIVESILNPARKISYGYQNSMPAYQGKLKAEQISLIVAYLKSIAKNVSDTKPSASPNK